MVLQDVRIASAKEVSASCGSVVMFWCQSFMGRPDQIPAARRLIRLLLEDYARADDIAWIATELFANAIRHSRSGAPGGICTLQLVRHEHTARVTVRDQGGMGRPHFTRAAAGLAEHGYGLLGIRALAADFGFLGTPATGHSVWAELLDFPADLDPT